MAGSLLDGGTGDVTLVLVGSNGSTENFSTQLWQPWRPPWPLLLLMIRKKNLRLYSTYVVVRYIYKNRFLPVSGQQPCTGSALASKALSSFLQKFGILLI